jgi:hypothetical protein
MAMRGGFAQPVEWLPALGFFDFFFLARYDSSQNIHGASMSPVGQFASGMSMV